MGREIEWKFTAGAADFAALAEKFGPFVKTEMETVYYDTHEGALAARHMTLRRRRENDTFVCTVKAPAAVGRGEWETEGEDILAAIPVFLAAGAPAELKDLTAGGVAPLCGARFTRLSALISLPGATAELALDRGVLLGAGKEVALQEVEVEYKSGSLEAAFAFAQSLGLPPEEKSKFARARALVK